MYQKELFVVPLDGKGRWFWRSGAGVARKLGWLPASWAGPGEKPGGGEAGGGGL